MSDAALEFLVDGEVRRIMVDLRESTVVIREGDAVWEAEVRRVAPGELRLRSAGRSVRVFLAREGERTYVALDGRQYVILDPRPGTGRPRGGGDLDEAGALFVKAPMPGKVTKVAVVEGEAVRRNQTLVIVEAMKMENEIRASVEGVVKKIHAAAGDVVDADKILVEIEPNAA